jgi:uncharacterized protein (TIGR03085 family)
MSALSFDAQERRALCDLLDHLGPDVPTLIDGWTARDLAAHLVLREHDLIAAPGLVLPGPYARYAERRRVTRAETTEFETLVAQIRSGPPPGFFRLGWVRTFPNLNEYFVHHEDVRRANGRGPRDPLAPGLDDALWRNVRRGGRYLSRKLRDIGLEIERAGSGERLPVRKRAPVVRLSGTPGELLLYLFGREDAAHVELTGADEDVARVRRAHFGM